MNRVRNIIVAFAITLVSSDLMALPEIVEKTELNTVIATTLADGLDHPWSLAFLPDGNMLVTERGGTLKLISANGELQSMVEGLPRIASKGQGGLLDIAVHPKFAENQWLYFSYAAGTVSGMGTEVSRAKLRGNELQEIELLFRMNITTHSRRHFGSRIVFDTQGHVFITLGDRGEKGRAQQLNDHAGSVIRISEKGLVPASNPFLYTDGALPEIFSYGHRNIQGAALHPLTGELWVHEHGPQGGDELNISRSGQNFGWPVISYGVNYGSGSKIGEGFEKAGMQQPLYYWVPSIAPSGMAFYSGDAVPSWQGDLFVGSLKFQTLVRLRIAGEKVVHEERIFKQHFGRIRDVRNGPDGYLYLLTDSNNGLLVRISQRN